MANTISKNIREEFGKEEGADLLIVDENFTPALLEKVLLAEYHDKILDACREADRLKKEAIENKTE